MRDGEKEIDLYYNNFFLGLIMLSSCATTIEVWEAKSLWLKRR